VANVKLYGIEVRAYDYEALKRIAETLAGYTSTGTKKHIALPKCVQLAAEAIAKAKQI
jgi:hypothetical protein